MVSISEIPNPMKNIFTTILFLLVLTTSFAQEDAWIYFTDKPNVEVAIANPLSILTQKAIDRKQNHNIAIDERDVPVNEAYVTDIKSQTGIVVMAKSKWFNAVHIRGTEDAINALGNLTFVDRIDFANQNLNTSLRSASVFNKTEIEESTVAFTYGDTQNQVEMINADELHLSDFTGEGMTIAVMDAGFPNVNTMDAFQRLRENGGLKGGYDFVDRTTAVYDFADNNHGTKVLSTMAGFIANEFVGTAPDASYYVFRTEDSGSENPVEESYWVEAAERADSLGVDMINTSLGYQTYDNPNYNYTPADMNGQTTYITKGASIAAEKGILVVVSAGNSGATDWQTVGAPADSPHVLSIGGVNADGDYVSFSSQGSAAQIGYQKPDVVARAGLTFVIDDNNAIVQNNGTSFSAPILCGGIAALWEAIPEASPTEVMNYVRQSASQYMNPDNFLGYGIPDLNVAQSLAVIGHNQELKAFKIYPNPVTTNLNIEAPIGINQMEVSVYNQIGQRILSQSIFENSNHLDVSGLASGVYVIELSSTRISKTFKFIKQ
ncbi:Por secretion system C-terminal sorting domain-containing protein [Winogradskyella sediminis]|uniref:Por secretion system C-terminal sorting domain-containing protein n=2 Tax=Winogradskyella sediminis TaxID=1382466 RepID=A0A1H1VAP6_9FLAO|nr:Por secretion system C-terminal sorting domain-containing protein [Winogradskyella sediminis]